MLHVIGETFTAGDVVLASILHLANTLKLAEDRPGLLRSMMRQVERPAVRRPSRTDHCCGCGGIPEASRCLICAIAPRIIGGTSSGGAVPTYASKFFTARPGSF